MVRVLVPQGLSCIGGRNQSWVSREYINKMLDLKTI